MMDFNELPQTKMGKLGEAICLEYLKKLNYCPYYPTKDQAHPFDILCASQDKKTIFVAEIKTKPHRLYYPDTGVNIRNYNDYLHIATKHNLDIWLMFVDSKAQSIYGGVLRTLAKPTQVLHNGKTLEYPIRTKKIIYFPLQNMNEIHKLTSVQSKQIETYTTRNQAYDYINVQKSHYA